ncbi:hypothetical protein P280DRAFT_156773 [Massarina eburnea CBS 473.64]|uniref:Uncharacterized protein n=1 Tax=Massarina eburnea CBS 473.64 TaxID=1395130 RepID=A0A6A6RQ77_9PLEO|nr:hypothetical protein P280DRAFT_156773 [Massarina eburnea CBS 473.64]
MTLYPAALTSRWRVVSLCRWSAIIMTVGTRSFAHLRTSAANFFFRSINIAYTRPPFAYGGAKSSASCSAGLVRLSDRTGYNSGKQEGKSIGIFMDNTALITHQKHSFCLILEITVLVVTIKCVQAVEEALDKYCVILQRLSKAPSACSEMRYHENSSKTRGIKPRQGKQYMLTPVLMLVCTYTIPPG